MQRRAFAATLQLERGKGAGEKGKRGNGQHVLQRERTGNYRRAGYAVGVIAPRSLPSIIHRVPRNYEPLCVSTNRVDNALAPPLLLPMCYAFGRMKPRNAPERVTLPPLGLSLSLATAKIYLPSQAAICYYQSTYLGVLTSLHLVEAIELDSSSRSMLDSCLVATRLCCAFS